MTETTEEERAKRLAEHERATERAGEFLKPGDKITYTSCPGTKRWGIFKYIEYGRYNIKFGWICTKTRTDIAAINISKVNGEPVDFTDKGVCSECSGLFDAGWNGTPANDPSCPCCGSEAQEEPL